jgi:hypothetical protein
MKMNYCFEQLSLFGYFNYHLYSMLKNLLASEVAL